MGWLRGALVASTGLLLAAGIAVGLSISPAPPPAAAARPVPKLTFEVSLDKLRYSRTDLVNARLTLTDDADIPVTGQVTCADTNHFDDSLANNVLIPADQLRGLLPLPAHDGLTITLTVPMPYQAYNTGEAFIACDLITSWGKYTAEASAWVIGASHAVSGRLHGCPQEPVSRIQIELTGTGEWKTTTDADGRFAFPVVPAGQYWIRRVPPLPYFDPSTNSQAEFVVTGDGTQLPFSVDLNNLSLDNACDYG